MQNYIVEHKFETAEDFLNALAPWSSSLSLDGFVFRGHSKVNYLLSPTSMRTSSEESIWECCLPALEITGSSRDNDYSLAYAEYQLIRDFYRKADARGLHVPISDRLRKRLHQEVDFRTMAAWIDGDKWLPNDMLEVAALAQHYGVPTRLLDWTYDPFVAAYFASKPPLNTEGDLCIWGLNTVTVGLFETVKKDFPLKLVTPHYSGNPNLAAQKGLFSHWATSVPGLDNISSRELSALPLVDRRPLDVLLAEYLKGTVNAVSRLFVKLVLPNSQALELANLLRKFGYGPSKLFPGYEGVAMELKERPLLKKSEGQML